LYIGRRCLPLQKETHTIWKRIGGNSKHAGGQRLKTCRRTGNSKIIGLYSLATINDPHNLILFLQKAREVMSSKPVKKLKGAPEQL
jgi:hypothetical protein